MRKLILAASATMLLASPAFAQTANNVNLTSTVAAACGVGNHISGGGTAPGFTSPAGGTLSIPSLADGNGQFNTAIEYTNISLGNLWCNNAANVTISVAALTNPVTTGDTGSFRSRFDVEIVTDAGVYLIPGPGTAGQDTAITTVGDADGVAELTGNSGEAFETGTGRFGGVDSLRILPSPRAAGGFYRPVAGTYTGYVRISATTS